MTTYSLCKIKYLANTDHEYRDYGVIPINQWKFRVCIENDEEKISSGKQYNVWCQGVKLGWNIIIMFGFRLPARHDVVILCPSSY